MYFVHQSAASSNQILFHADALMLSVLSMFCSVRVYLNFAMAPSLTTVLDDTSSDKCSLCRADLVAVLPTSFIVFIPFSCNAAQGLVPTDLRHLRFSLLLLPQTPCAVLAPELCRCEDAVKDRNQDFHGQCPPVPQSTVQAEDSRCLGEGADQ